MTDSHDDRRVDVALFYRNLGLGGVQHMMVMLANGLAGRGYKVELVLGDVSQAFRTELDPSIRLVDLKSPGVIGLVPGLIRYLRRARPRVLFTAVPNCNAVAVAARLLAFSRTKVVISERSDTRLEFENTPVGLYKLSIMLIPFTYRLADRIVAVSKGTADSLAKFGRLNRKKIDVIYNPSFNENIPIQATAPLDHQWIREGRKIVVSAGRLCPQKNYELLIAAAAKVHAKDDSVRFLILGEGPDRQKLEALRDEMGLKGVLELPGADTNPYRWFAASDVYVMSSLWEGFGNVLVQALACGCKIVSTDCPSGPREILADGAYGALVPVGDVGGMAEAIHTAIGQKADKARLFARAREFSLDAALAQYEVIFDLAPKSPA